MKKIRLEARPASRFFDANTLLWNHEVDYVEVDRGKGEKGNNMKSISLDILAVLDSRERPSKMTPVCLS